MAASLVQNAGAHPPARPSTGRERGHPRPVRRRRAGPDRRGAPRSAVDRGSLLADDSAVPRAPSLRGLRRRSGHRVACGSDARSRPPAPRPDLHSPARRALRRARALLRQPGNGARGRDRGQARAGPGRDQPHRSRVTRGRRAERATGRSRASAERRAGRGRDRRAARARPAAPRGAEPARGDRARRGGADLERSSLTYLFTRTTRRRPVPPPARARPVVGARCARPGRRRARASARLHPAGHARPSRRRMGHGRGRRPGLRRSTPWPATAAPSVPTPRAASRLAPRGVPRRALDGDPASAWIGGWVRGERAWIRWSAPEAQTVARPAARRSERARAPADGRAPSLGRRGRQPEAEGLAERRGDPSPPRAGASFRARGPAGRVRARRALGAAAQSRGGHSRDRGGRGAAGGARRPWQPPGSLRRAERAAGGADARHASPGGARRLRGGEAAARAPLRPRRSGARGDAASFHDLGRLRHRQPAADLPGRRPGAFRGRSGRARARHGRRRDAVAWTACACASTAPHGSCLGRVTTAVGAPGAAIANSGRRSRSTATRTVGE